MSRLPPLAYWFTAGQVNLRARARFERRRTKLRPTATGLLRVPGEYERADAARARREKTRRRRRKMIRESRRRNRGS